VTKRICIALQKKDREIALHGYESGRIVRLPGGEYIEVHQPVDDYERFKLADFDTYEPLVVRPNAKGQIPWHENLRSSVSRWFFEDRLQPLTQAQIEEADAHQQHTLAHDAEIETAEILGAHARAGVTSEDQLAPVDVTVGEAPNTPSSVIAQEPADKPRKKKSEDGE
jgi:ubiquinol-cytochrome c reductase cytochrome b subunit